MGLLDAYQDSTDRALTVMAARPIDQEPPKPKHSGWTTIPRAVAGAFVETAGNIMDVASAYGQVQAATGANANPLIPDSPEDRKQRLEAFDKLKDKGIDWQPEESRPHYQMARDLRPDPLTAGAAENIVFGLTKGLTKAIGAGMIAGPVAGAGAFGVSEGMTTAEDLAAQGVDPVTRQKVGVLTGAVSAASMALPVAGKTLAGTAALVAVGGPVSFVAQQAATRAILENADYGKLAQQYDPLDPVGLALATLLPAGFATWAKAGAISAAMKGKPKAAADPVPMTPEPIRPTATQDQVDAAMVHNLTIARDAHEAVPIEAVQAALEPAKTQADAAEVLRPAVEPVAQSPIVMFRREAADIEASLPPVAGGFTRLWRGNRPGEVGQNPQFTNDLAGIALPFRNAYKGPLSFVDVPTQNLQQYLNRGVAADGAEFILPQEVAAKAAEYAVPKVGAGDTAPTPQQATGAVPQPKATDPHIASTLSRVEALKAQSPDLPVALREDGTPVTLAEELDAIRRQAREGTADTFGADDAPLIQVAVECMLSMGAA